MQKLGYSLQDAQVGVGLPPPFEGLNTHSSDGNSLLTVDMEV